MKEAISDAENKKFSEFAKKTKTSLEDKLRNNPTIKAKGEELRNLQKMRDTFAQIKKPGADVAPIETPVETPAEEPAATPTETPAED